MTVDRSRLPVAGPAPVVHLPTIQKSALANGLAVWTVEHNSVPVVTFVLVVPAGSAQDPPGLEGLASLTGDMLDEGSGPRSAIDMHDALARIGAQFETEVGVDASFVVLTTLTQWQPRGLALLADITTRPALAEAEVTRVRQLRLNRLAQLRDLPPFVAQQVFTRFLFGDHPYGHLPVGSPKTLAAATGEAVRTYHRRVFVPRGATLVAVGSAPHRELLAAVKEAFGGWQPDRDAVDHVPAEIPDPADRLPAGRIALVHRAGAAQSELRAGRIAAARDTPDYHPLLVLNTILGGQFISRINMNLRQKKGFTYGARTAFEFHRRRGPFVFQSSVQSRVTADALREAMGEIGAIRDERPPTAEEIETAKAALTLGYGRNFETAQQVARAVAQLALYGLPDDYFEQFVPRVNAVTVEDLRRVAQAYLDPDRMGIVVVGDRDVVGPGLSSLGYGEPVALAAE